MQRLMLITCTASEVFAMCGWPTRRPTGNPAMAQWPNTDHYTDFSCESKTKKMHRLHVSVFTSFFQPPPPPPPYPPKCCPPSLHTQCIFLVTWKMIYFSFFWLLFFTFSFLSHGRWFIIYFIFGGGGGGGCCFSPFLSCHMEDAFVFLTLLFTFSYTDCQHTKIASAKCFKTTAMEDSFSMNLLPLHCKLSAHVSWLWAIDAQETHTHTHTQNIQQQQLTQHRPTLSAGLWPSMLRNSTETNRGLWIRQKQQSQRQPDTRNQQKHQWRKLKGWTGNALSHQTPEEGGLLQPPTPPIPPHPLKKDSPKPAIKEKNGWTWPQKQQSYSVLARWSYTGLSFCRPGKRWTRMKRAMSRLVQ